MSNAPSFPPETESRGVNTLLDCVSFGLKVWLSEMKWLLREAVSGLETRQLAKRMEQERSRKRTAASEEDRQSAGRQAAFLEEEINRLAQDRRQRREHYVAARIKAWGLDRA